MTQSFQPVAKWSDLHPSPTQPRKTFEGIDELAASMREVGVLTPLLCRPKPGGNNGALEVVAGERRRRAAGKAKLAEVPVHVLELSDVEAAEIQLVENDQREDVPPLEEADAYAALQELGKPVTEIAARIGRPEAYVHRRLVLTQLGKKARKMLDKAEISIGVAEVLARIPNPKLQDQAAEQLAPDYRGLRTVTDAKAHVKRHFMLRIADAKWSADDAELVPKAGACSACPKRTGAQAALFPEESADLCIDPGCWGDKTEALAKQRLEEAKAKGQEILASKEAKKIWPSEWTSHVSPQGTGFVDLDETAYGSGSSTRPRKWRNILGKKRMPPVVVATNPHTGEAHELVRLADAKKAAKQAPRDKDPDILKSRSSSSSTSVSAAEKNWKLESKAKKQAAEQSVGELVALVESDDFDADETFWRLLAEGALQGAWSEIVKGTAGRRGVEVPKGTRPEDALRTLLGTATSRQACGFLVELVVRKSLSNLGATTYDTKEPYFAQRMLEQLGIDWLANEKAAIKEARDAAKAKAAKKKSAKKRSAKRGTKKATRKTAKRAAAAAKRPSARVK